MNSIMNDLRIDAQLNTDFTINNQHMDVEQLFERALGTSIFNVKDNESSRLTLNEVYFEFNDGAPTKLPIRLYDSVAFYLQLFCSVVGTPINIITLCQSLTRYRT